MKRETLLHQGGFLADAMPAPEAPPAPPAASLPAPAAASWPPAREWPPAPPPLPDLPALVRQARQMADMHRTHAWARPMRQLADALAPYLAGAMTAEEG